MRCACPCHPWEVTCCGPQATIEPPPANEIVRFYCRYWFILFQSYWIFIHFLFWEFKSTPYLFWSYVFYTDFMHVQCTLTNFPTHQWVCVWSPWALSATVMPVSYFRSTTILYKCKSLADNLRALKCPIFPKVNVYLASLMLNTCPKFIGKKMNFWIYRRHVHNSVTSQRSESLESEGYGGRKALGWGRCL